MDATHTRTLAEFLLARIAEDEALARAAYDDLTFGNDEGEVGTGWAAGLGYEHNHLGDPASVMTRRWSPERILAECEAKRRIVEDLNAPLDDDDMMDPYEGDGWEKARWVVLRDLALPYDDHPDYRDEWKP